MPEAPLRILFVEDNPSDAKLLDHELRRGGLSFVSSCVDSETEYLAELVTEPDIVLCDWQMPQFDSLRALALLQERWPDTPFILVSGSIGEEAAVNIIKRGACDYVLKDRLGRLVVAVSQALSRRDLQKKSRLADEARRQSEIQLAEAQRIARLGSWVWDPIHDIVVWSDTIFTLFGLDPATTQPSFATFLSVLHPDDRPTAISRVEAILAGADEFANDFRLVRPNGVSVWIHSRARATRDESGRIVRVEGTDLDITDRKRSEAELQYQHSLLRSQIEASPDGILVDGPGERVLHWNRRFLEIWGVPETLIQPGDVTPVFALALSRTADPAAFSERVKEILARPDLNSHDEVLLADGRTLDRHSSPVHGASRELLGRVWYFRDITEQKRAENAIRASEERYRLAIRATNDAVWDIDLTTGKIEWNDQYANSFGRPLATSKSWQWWIDRIHPEDRDRTNVGLRAAIDGESDYWSCEYRFLRMDGVWAEIHDRAYISRDTSGKAVRVVGSMQDVTDRKRSESELRRTSTLLQAVVNGTTDAIFVKDREGKYLLFNKAGARMVGKAVDDLIGKDDSCWAEPAIARLIRERDLKVMASGREETEEESWNIAGTTRTFLTTKVPHRNAQGDIIGVLGISRDITDRKRLEAQFQQAHKMEAVGQLAGGIAHDFNNLLTVINGYSEQLLKDMPRSDVRTADIEAIRDAGKRAAELTAQLLAFSRKTMVVPKVLDLHVLIENLGKMLPRLIGEDILFSTAFKTGPARIRADAGQIEQVFINLAVNARDAMPLGGRLTIETAEVAIGQGEQTTHNVRPGRYHRVRIIDTGCGMTPEVQARIFDPFFTTKAEGEGTGLGLATAFGIVTQAGGSISVASEVGHGSTFTILLPVVVEDSESQPRLKLQSALQGQETILLVEDEVAVLRIARLVLEKQGYQVIAVTSGREAIKAAESHDGTIDLLLTDVIMPGMGGRELAETLQVRWRDMKVLYMSGYTSDAIIRYGVESAKCAFLQKPFTPFVLAQTVRDVLKLRKT